MTRWIAVTVVASIISALDGGWLASWAALAPAKVWRGQLWRLVTWPLIEHGPIALVLTCAAIYKLGGDLAVRWGDRRLRRFTLEIIVGAATATCVLAAVAGGGSLHRFGGWVVPDVLVIAWARQFPSEVLVLYGLLRLRGRELVRLTVAVAVLLAIFVGPVYAGPELFACLAAALYPAWLLRR